MTTFQFDHVVQYLEKPEDIISKLKEHGIHALEGGRHEGRGTYNALSYFDLSYIEFLGSYDKPLVAESKPVHHSMIETIIAKDFEEGFVRFAARTEDIHAEAEKFKALGLTVNGPFPLYRKRPDGSVISWQLLYIGEENDSLKLPFIIQWDDNDEVRRQQQIEQGVIGLQQPNVDFEGVLFAVENAEETASKWAKYLDLSMKNSFVDQGLNAKVVVLDLQGGELQFAEPLGEGIVQTTLEKDGEVPLQVNFLGFKEEKIVTLQNGRYAFKK